ncbi:carbohydrate ABC transporter permease [Cryobacterium tagatosivorans]|nr:sugar ABC transporter permease [Cryobacterium tagatosivorans]
MVTLFGQSLTYQGDWVGLENFQLVLSDPLFTTGLRHNFLLLLAVPVVTAVALLVAIVLFETKKGLGFFRAVVFMPYILAVPVVAVVFGQLLQRNGPINQALHALGLDMFAFDWLGDPNVALWTMAGIIMWKEVGFGVVLILARMLTVSTEIYEAAKLDGAGFWRTHWSITLPQVGGIVAFYMVNEAITMVSWVFNYVYVLTNGQGGPGDATVVSELYIYRNAFQYMQPELAAAAAVILFLGTMVLVAVFFHMQRRSLRRTLSE